MKRSKNFKHTIFACFSGYVVQAIIVNFAPLLFVTFQKDYAISLERVSFLITLTFGLQLLVDALSPRLVAQVGYRVAAVSAQLFAAAGLVGLAVFPRLFPDPYAGLLLASGLYAIGGGLDEVVISPIVESCPTERKAATMSLLHSFYCWGQFFTVLVSTAFFALCGIENWTTLALLWAVVPLADAVFFLFVPMPSVPESEAGVMRTDELLRKKRFWLLALVTVCGGASELCISQWASAFVQTGLGVDKTIGDLAGPCAFAALMGLSRVLYAKFSERLNMPNAMLISGVLCMASYLLAALSPWPAVGLIGCALAGFSVGVLWPCALSLGAAGIKNAGMTMFALLALFGDLGCTTGPTLVGVISDGFGGNLKVGILFALAFPVLLILGVLLYKRDVRRHGEKN